MFEDLKRGYTLENLKKVKENNKKMRYQEESDSNERRPQQMDDSLSEVDVDFEERQQNYNRIFNVQEREEPETFLRRNEATPPSKIRKMEHELQMSNQKLKLQERSHKREIQFMEEVHKRRQDWLKSENEKLTMLNKKIKEENSSIKEVKRELFSTLEIKEVLEKRLEQKDFEIKEVQKKLSDCQKEYKKFLSKNITNQHAVQGESGRQKRIEEKIKYLEEQCKEWKKLSEERDRKNGFLNGQINRLKNKVNEDARASMEEGRKLKDCYQGKVEKLENEIKELRKRNKELEQSFFQKIGEMTKLQMTLLSNQTQNTTQKIIYQAANEQSINLQDESPIKEKGKSCNKKMENPELKECYCCEKKIRKVKQKLNEANRKIMELLENKIKIETKPNRNRICSWAAKR